MGLGTPKSVVLDMLGCLNHISTPSDTMKHPILNQFLNKSLLLPNRENRFQDLPEDVANPMMRLVGRMVEMTRLDHSKLDQLSSSVETNGNDGRFGRFATCKASFLAF